MYMTKTKYYTLSMFESAVLSLISKNNGVTASELTEQLQLPESTITRVLNKHQATGNIKLTDGKYVYSKPIDGKIVMLEGTMLLPVSVIEQEDCIYVCRGEWYKFEKGFDIRRIVWNCKLTNNGNEQNARLVDLLTASMMKERKSDIVHQPEYDYLVNKLVPYSSDILLHIKKVGEIKAEVIIVFNMLLTDEDGSIALNHRKFGVKSEIDTQQLMTELEKEPDDRDYNNIKLDRVISINDMIYTNNEIPIEYPDNNKESLTVMVIKKGKGDISFVEKNKNMFGNETVIDEYKFDNITEGLGVIIEKMTPLVNQIMKKTDFELDLEL